MCFGIDADAWVLSLPKPAEENGEFALSRPEDAVVLIPSLHPDRKLGDYVNDLIANGFSRIVIVDDGSGPDYRHHFESLAALPECTVLSYPENHGKGYALKYGMEHVLKAFPAVPGVITADSDGQHNAEDCLKVTRAMLEKPGRLVLGTRDFSQHDVPGKSRAGNRLTSFFFVMLYGHWLPDTQTGLRGISRQLLPKAIGIPGERFEYEMNMLIHCAGWHMDFEIVPIKTIYLENNASSHFRAFRDSARIYKLLFSNFFRFASSSALASLLDIGLFTVLDKWLIPATFPSFASSRDYSLVLAATAIARISSALFNYKVNRQFVFQIESRKGALLRYAILVAIVMVLSAIMVAALNSWLGIDKTLVKIVVDTLLFFINYRIQKTWVFSSPEERKTEA